MRQAGLYPTEAELEEMKRQLGGKGKGKVVDYESFMGYIHRNYQSIDREKELTNAFKVFDNDGVHLIDINVLRNLMTDSGEKMEETEFDAVLRGYDLIEKDGKEYINYEELVRLMMAH
jgi:Ca2+-binding EF-hand superfamily protein